MAFLPKIASSFAAFVSRTVTAPVLPMFQPVRTKYADHRMIKDVRKRRCVAEHGAERLRVNALRKNDILPLELREIASAEIHAQPRDSSITRIRPRCALTSRPRGTVHRWRMSRMVFRSLADYNKLSSVQRAMW